MREAWWFFNGLFLFLLFLRSSTGRLKFLEGLVQNKITFDQKSRTSHQAGPIKVNLGKMELLNMKRVFSFFFHLIYSPPAYLGRVNYGNIFASTVTGISQPQLSLVLLISHG